MKSLPSVLKQPHYYGKTFLPGSKDPTIHGPLVGLNKFKGAQFLIHCPVWPCPPALGPTWTWWASFRNPRPKWPKRGGRGRNHSSRWTHGTLMGTHPRLSQAGLKTRTRVLQHLQSGSGDKVLKTTSKVFLKFACGWWPLSSVTTNRMGPAVPWRILLQRWSICPQIYSSWNVLTGGWKYIHKTNCACPTQKTIHLCVDGISAF